MLYSSRRVVAYLSLLWSGVSADDEFKSSTTIKPSDFEDADDDGEIVSHNMAPEGATFSISGEIVVPEPLIKNSKEPGFAGIMKDIRLYLESPAAGPGDGRVSRLGFVDREGRFEFNNLPMMRFKQLFFLELNHPMFNFEQLTIESNGRKSMNKRVKAFPTNFYYTDSSGLSYFSGDWSGSDKGGAKQGSFNIRVKCNGIKQQFEEREEFSLMSLFKNPMVLITLFMMGMMYMMPKPEEMQKMRAELDDSKKSGNDKKPSVKDKKSQKGE